MKYSEDTILQYVSGWVSYNEHYNYPNLMELTSIESISCDYEKEVIIVSYTYNYTLSDVTGKSEMKIKFEMIDKYIKIDRNNKIDSIMSK